jgi:hypothetical protein
LTAQTTQPLSLLGVLDFGCLEGGFERAQSNVIIWLKGLVWHFWVWRLYRYSFRNKSYTWGFKCGSWGHNL